MRKFLVAAAVVTLCAGGSAMAESKADHAAKTTRLQPSNSSISLDQKVCVREQGVTGSRLSRQECHSYREWLEQGVDPFAK